MNIQEILKLSGKFYQKHIKTNYKEEYEAIQNSPGHSFAEKLYNFINGNTKLNTCPICGKSTKFRNLNVGYTKTCSYICAGGTEEAKRKMSEIQKSKNVRDKTIQTNLSKYGEKYHMSSQSSKVALQETNMKMYGVPWITNSEYFKNKVKKTWLSKYGVDNPSKDLLIHRRGRATAQKLHIGTIEDKTFEYQGYEFKVLEWLFKTYNISIQNLNMCETSIKYKFLDKEHTYFPDILIGDNICIEVKSAFTIKLDPDRIFAKAQAAAQTFAKYFIIVWDEKLNEPNSVLSCYNESSSEDLDQSLKLLANQSQLLEFQPGFQQT